MKRQTIGQVAAQAGIAASAIRYYEAIGLLPEPTRVSGQRRYGDEVLQKLGLIRLAQDAGFTLAEIQSLLYDFPPDAPPPARWQQLAQRKLAEVEEQLRSLLAMKRLLEETLASCECATLEECGALALEGINPEK